MTLGEAQQVIWMLGLLLLVLVIAVGVFIWHTVKLYKRLGEEIAKGRKILSQKKSSEVRLGKIGENMAPFIKDWPYEHRRFRFIGDPIDGIQFTDEEIIFVEIKTGRSRLTTSQRNIKRLVAAGKVSFATFRISENGCVLKKESMDHCNLCDEDTGC